MGKENQNMDMTKNGAAYIEPVILKSILIIFCFLFVLVETPWAHPHVFIAQRLKIVTNGKGLTGFNIYWEFDEMFSTMKIGRASCRERV